MSGRVRLLRYSGSKADVIGELLEHVSLEDSPETVFWDVFTGSGSVAEGVAKKYPNVKIVMNDLDRNLAALHQIIGEGTDHDFDTVLDMLDIMPTIEMFKEVLNSNPKDPRRRAFKAMFMNRTCDSRANGMRPMGGWDQDGVERITSRYKYHNIVKTMLERRMLLKGRVSVTSMDFRKVLAAAQVVSGFVYCDPVYWEVGNDLYHTTPKWLVTDHTDLQRVLMGMDNKWLLSYNDHSFVRDLYSNCDIYPMRMPSHSQGGAKIELLIKPKEKFVCQEQGTLTGESQTKL
jgi:DNA adenine methylase